MTHAVCATASGPGIPEPLPPLPPAPATACQSTRKATSRTRLYTRVLSRSCRADVMPSSPLDRKAREVLHGLRRVEGLLLADEERVGHRVLLGRLVAEGLHHVAALVREEDLRGDLLIVEVGLDVAPPLHLREDPHGHRL